MKPTESGDPRRPADPARHGGSGDYHGDQAHLHNPEVAHEHSDVAVRPILWFLAIVSAVTAMAMVAMWALFLVLEHQAAGRDPALSPLAVPAGQMPPEPRLLTDEIQFHEQFQAQEDRMLHEYGWVDEAAGIAHMPIEQAKRLIVERGLPARAEEAPGHVGGYLRGRGEASSGRAITWEQPPYRPARDRR